MNLDKQAQEVVDQIMAAHMPPINTLSPFNARMLPTVADAVKAVVAKHPLDRSMTPIPQPVGKIEHRTIPGQGRDDVLLRVYTPKDGDGPFPVLVYFHGGGFVIANLDTYDATCRALTNQVGCVTMSVAYHQAPEHKFPAAVEDAFAAYQWALAHAAEINGDPARVAVAGESAGGNLAAVTTLMARDKGVRLPLHQLLVYPMTNYAFDTPSYQEHADAKPLNKPMMEWFWQQYLPDAPAGSNPYASPLRAQDLHGLSPATVITDENDPLWSEGEAYADRLREAGVPVTYRHYDGVMHEFFSMAAALDKAKDANQVAVTNLKQAFAGTPMTADDTMMTTPGRMPARTTATTAEPMHAPDTMSDEPMRTGRDRDRTTGGKTMITSESMRDEGNTTTPGA